MAFARRGKHALEIQRFTHSMSADIVFDATSGEGHFGYLSPSKHGSPFEQMAPCTLVNQIAHFKRCRSWEQFRRQTSTHCRGYIARWHPCRLCIHVYIYIYIYIHIIMVHHSISHYLAEDYLFEEGLLRRAGALQPAAWSQGALHPTVWSIIYIYIYMYIDVHVHLSLYISLTLSLSLSLYICIYIYIYIFSEPFPWPPSHTPLAFERGPGVLPAMVEAP